ncbi:MAG: heavy metal translocating P-type ATPase [Tissierella sp.]|uniref:heavy metal translocating P-type ATPase n=1 Tax=Tissierella sp. TaxID=41274 RepID=UPI003F98A7E1
MENVVLELEGLNCASCAGKIEKLSGDLDGVENTSLDFISKKLKIKISKDSDKQAIINNIIGIIKKLEPDVKVHEESIGGISSDSKDKEAKDHEYKSIIRILIGGIIFLIPYLFKFEDTTRFMFYLTSYIIVGHKVITIAFKNVIAGVPFDENFLMTIATVGAFVIGEYPEGVAVMLFYNIGELFQDRAVNHSRKSIKALMDIRPDSANLIVDKHLKKVSPNDVHIGDYIIIKAGEKVPLDGIVVEGESSLDTSNITGESVPRKIKSGEEIISGVVNNQGLLKVKVSKEFGESTISKILDLVENASSKKAKTENFITKFAKYYTPAVVFIALGIGVIPTILGIGQASEWAYKAFVFLVISCPCALVISIPLGFFGGIGAASKEGILIKGGNYLEALNDVDTIVFDKTGTITKGTFKVTDILAYEDFSKETVLEIAALGESFSNHPIAKSILESYHGEIDKNRIENYKELSGKGVSVDIDGNNILLGNKKLLEEEGISIKKSDTIGTIVYIGKDKKHIGTIIVSDELKEDIKETLVDLKTKMGIDTTIMLSGDNEGTTKKVANIAGIDKSFGNLLPDDKVRLLEKTMKNKNNKKKTIFIGDGVNDAPVLARADIGISMGALGSDAAIEASDIVIMTDQISNISTAMKIAKKTKIIVIQNIALALGIKLIVLSLGAFGFATMWQAVFADVGVTVLAVLNSIRALKVE